MDLKVYYEKIREVEKAIAESDAVVVSRETADGGRAGMLVEVPRRTAAKLIVLGRARLASAEEAEEFRSEAERAREAARQAAEAQRIRIAVVPERELRPRGKSGSKATR